MSQYQYPITTFPNDRVSKVVLDAAIEAAIPGKLEDSSVGAAEVTIDFTETLTAEEEGKLVNVIGQHTGDILPARIISAPTWETTDGLAPGWEGYLYTATAGATSMFDELISTQIRLRGGWYEIMAAAQVALGDYIEFSIVDKDDVLGLFSTYGLTVGQPGHVLELRKYVKKDYVNPGSYGQREEFQVGGGFDVMAGLYFRTTYHSIGSVNVDFKATVLSYE